MNEIWLPGTGSRRAEERLARQRKAIDDALMQLNSWRIREVDPLLKPYVDTSKIPNLQVTTPDLTQYWNCGVRTAIKSIAEFDAKRTYEKLVKLSESLTQSPTEQVKSKSETDEKKSS